MHKGFLKTAALLGALTVILGAFGAHTLKQYITEQSILTFETGVRYQFYHVFALFLTGILYKEFSNKSLLWAGRMFSLGIFLFSGSLYFLSLINLTANTGLRGVGAITPLGGACFIAGWMLLFTGVSKKSN